VAHDISSQAGPFTPLGIHQDVPSVTVAVRVVQEARLFSSHSRVLRDFIPFLSTSPSAAPFKGGGGASKSRGVPAPLMRVSSPVYTAGAFLLFPCNRK
jgi:hypothetical protein